MSDYDAVVFSVCLLAGSAIAVWHRACIASIIMVATATVLLAIRLWGISLMNFRSDPVGAAEWFPFDSVSRISKILFGLSFVGFLWRERRTHFTRRI